MFYVTLPINELDRDLALMNLCAKQRDNLYKRGLNLSLMILLSTSNDSFRLVFYRSYM